MKAIAEKNLNREVKKVVITVPAYFDNAMRSATKAAAEMIGLEVIRLVNEPTAAAFAYAQKLDKQESGKILVFDLGGGTFDVTVLSFVCESSTFKVECTSGDLHLGGRDWDALLEKYVFDKVAKEGVSLSENKKYSVRDKIVKAKERLSYAMSEQIEINDELEITVTRDEFEFICQDLWQKCLDVVHHLLEDAKINKLDLDEIILVGGSTRMPKITALLKDYFGQKMKIHNYDPDEAVAHGAAIYAYSLLNKKEKKGISVSDVSAHDIGIALRGTDMSPMLKRFNAVTFTCSGNFTPVLPYSPTALVEVYQGNHPKVADNHKIGQMLVTGYTPGPSVLLRINMTVNEDGMLNLKCMVPEQANVPAKELEFSLTGSHIMTKDEIKYWIQKIKDLACGIYGGGINNNNNNNNNNSNNIVVDVPGNKSGPTDDNLDKKNPVYVNFSKKDSVTKDSEKMRQLKDLVKKLKSVNVETEVDKWLQENDGNPDIDEKQLDQQIETANAQLAFAEALGNNS